jgi:hypothetical protein
LTITKEIVAENKLKNKVSSLEDYAIEVVVEPEKNFNNAMGQESLTRFDQPKPKKTAKNTSGKNDCCNSSKPVNKNNNNRQQQGDKSLQSQENQ